MAKNFDLSNLPLTLEGEKRFLIYLDQKPHEDDLRISLLPSYPYEVDDNYNYFVDAYIAEKKTMHHAPRYYVCTSSHIIGKKKEKEEASNTKSLRMLPILFPKVLPYSSAAPIVVYLPEGAKLRYEILSTMDTGYGVRKPDHVLSTHQVWGPS